MIDNMFSKLISNLKEMQFKNYLDLLKDLNFLLFTVYCFGHLQAKLCLHTNECFKFENN